MLVLEGRHPSGPYRSSWGWTLQSPAGPVVPGDCECTKAAEGKSEAGHVLTQPSSGLALISLSAPTGYQLSAGSLAVGWVGRLSWLDSAFQVLSGTRWPTARETRATGERDFQPLYPKARAGREKGAPAPKFPGVLTTAVTPSDTAENQFQAGIG